MEHQGCIYKIENLVNGKMYIGQTRRSFEVRISAHKSMLKSNRHPNDHLQSAWNIDGEENFSFSVIEICSWADLDDRECHYIRTFNSFRCGYNQTTGGSQVMHDKNHTEETKKSISLINLSNWSDPNFRKKMMMRPVYTGSKAPRSLKVICINDQKIFDTLTEAGEHYGIGLKKVSSNCTGKTKYTGLEETGIKLQFSYYEEGKEYKLEDINHKNEKKRVRCINTGEVFSSMKEAEGKTGAPTASIAHVCKGRRKHAGKLSDGTKLKWAYVD